MRIFDKDIGKQFPNGADRQLFFHFNLREGTVYFHTSDTMQGKAGELVQECLTLYDAACEGQVFSMPMRLRHISTHFRIPEACESGDAGLDPMMGRTGGHIYAAVLEDEELRQKATTLLLEITNFLRESRFKDLRRAAVNTLAFRFGLPVPDDEGEGTDEDWD